MTLSPLQRSLLPALFAASTVFAATTVPFALHRSQVIEIEVQNKPVVSTELKHLSGPFLGIAGSISAAIGISVLGMSGWRQASRKSETTKTRVSELEQELLMYQSELERIRFSEARLQAHSLDSFLAPAPQAKPQPNLVLAQPLASSETTPEQEQDFAYAAPSATIRDADYELLAQAKDAAAAAEVESQQIPNGQLDQLVSQLQTLASQVEELRGARSSRLAA